MLAAINEVLAENNYMLNDTIQAVKEGDMPTDRLVLVLSMLLASNKTLEVITRPQSPIQMQRPKVDVKAPPAPAFVAEVENDNPEMEDPEVKKLREEDRRFFD